MPVIMPEATHPQLSRVLAGVGNAIQRDGEHTRVLCLNVLWAHTTPDSEQRSLGQPQGLQHVGCALGTIPTDGLPRSHWVASLWTLKFQAWQVDGQGGSRYRCWKLSQFRTLHHHELYVGHVALRRLKAPQYSLNFVVLSNTRACLKRLHNPSC